MTVLIVAAAWIVVSFAAGLILGRVLRGRNGQLPVARGPYESSSAYTPESTARLREFVNADQPLPEDEIRGRS